MMPLVSPQPISSGLFRSRPAVRLLLAGLLVAVGSSCAAQGTKLWTQTRLDELEHGTPDGVQMTSDGKLLSGPNAYELLTTPSTFVWAVVPGKGGEIYLATGSPATVLRVSKSGKGDTEWKSEKLFETKALAVQAMVLGPDGSLYAATLPDGKVYRIKADASKAVDEASAEVVFDLGKMDDADTPKTEAKPDAKSADASSSTTKSDSKARYIWDLTFDAAGRLYVATGGPGAIYRVDVKAAKPATTLFFKSDEQHIRTLVWDKAGNLVAGTDGSGLVYRISPEGKGYVLFSAPRREVTALAIAADGTIYEADAGDKSHNPLPQLQVQPGASSITISFVQPGSVQAANASTALPEGTEIFALKENQAPRKIWSGKDDIVYKLQTVPDGMLALTGNRGRILTIHPDGSFSDVAHLEAQQAVSLASLPGGYLLGTANTGKLYLLEDDSQSKADSAARPYARWPAHHAYASDVLDAGAMSRWGRVEVDPGSHDYKIWTRSGNVEQPVRKAKDWGWSDWQVADAGKVISPPGRYLQWKVELVGAGEVVNVGVNYLPVNAAPAVDDVLVVPGARYTPQPAQSGQPAQVTIAFPNAGQNGGVAFDANAANATAPIQAQKDRTAVTVRWNAHDDNGDDLKFDLYLRGDGEQVWRPLKKNLTDKVYSFDGSTLPDGGYQVKVVASDAPSHSPGDALTGELVSDRFELDTTPPTIAVLKAGIPAKAPCQETPCDPEWLVPVTFDAKDATSPISHAEYSVDAGPWQYIEPVGELSDSKEEHYSVMVPLRRHLDDPTDTQTGKVGEATMEHLITVRAYDRHDNVATAKVIVPAMEPKH